MKYLFGFLLILIAVLLGVGFYVKNSMNFESGQILIGIGVLLIAFVLMPLFIFYRYKNKDLTGFKFKNSEKEDRKK